MHEIPGMVKSLFEASHYQPIEIAGKRFACPEEVDTHRRGIGVGPLLRQFDQRIRLNFRLQTQRVAA